MSRFAEQLVTHAPPLPKGFAEIINKLEPFVKDQRFPIVLFDKGSVRTEEGDYSASVEGFDLPDLRYDMRVLKLVVEHATHALFQLGAGVFRDEHSDLRGIFVSLRS
jgi:hypothetical protein